MPEGRVLGCGIDLVENERMRQVLERWGSAFKDRVFLAPEQEYCEAKADPCRHYAARFAVKEAVSKALGTGLGPRVGLRDIEVVRDCGTGAPSVRLSARTDALVRQLGGRAVLISLSHTDGYAVAQALLVG